MARQGRDQDFRKVEVKIGNVMGWISMLQDYSEGEYSPEELEDFYLQIQIEGTQLMDLAANASTLIRIESGKYTLTLNDVSPAHVVQFCIDALEDLAQERDVTITVESASAKASVQIDPGTLTHMVGNLLSNAIVASPKGDFVRVVISAASDRCCISVTDNGPGITDEEIDRARRPYGGIGEVEGVRGLMGLRYNVVDRLANIQSGSLEFESGSGTGTMSTLQIPVSPDLSSDLAKQDIVK